MNRGTSVFSQLMQFVPHGEFRKCVARYRGDYKVKTFSCYDQFLCMTFAQLTYRDSLRDLVACLGARSSVLYHMGIRAAPSLNNLANANMVRDWRIYADFAMVLIGMARGKYGNTPIPGLELDAIVYALDSSTIDLCLSLFPWADFRKTKAAVKLHTLLDLRANVPAFIHISNGKLHDVNVLRFLPVEAGAYYIMDRGYLHFERLHAIQQEKAYFVTRSKCNMDFLRVSSSPVDKSSGLRCDQTIRLRGTKSKTGYPDLLRRVAYRDLETGKRLIFLTNNLTLPAIVIAQLYKKRWQVELFFKWIKQNLSIRHFYGTTENAAKTQLWIAVCAYVIAVLAHRALKAEISLTQMLQIFSVTPFDKVPLVQLLTDSCIEDTENKNHNQLLLNI
jgi:hypothetical protein